MDKPSFPFLLSLGVREKLESYEFTIGLHYQMQLAATGLTMGEYF